MKNRKYKLLPYKVIEKAVAGEPEAVNAVYRITQAISSICPIFKGISTTI